MDNTSPPLSYHPVTMTINGVTKSVLVPMPKTVAHSRPATAKLPDGRTIIVAPNCFPSAGAGATTVADKNSVLLATAPASSTAASVLQHLAVASTLPGTASIKRPIVTIRPIVCVRQQKLPEGRGTVVSASPRLPVPRAVAVEYPSGLRKIVPISPPAAAPHSTCVRLTPKKPHVFEMQERYGPPRVYKSQPIILRKNLPSSTRPACLVVVRPSNQSPVSSTPTFVNSSSTTSALTVVSSPRTLSRHEAVAAGWYTGLGDVDDDDDEMHADVVQKTSAGSAELITADDAPFAVRNIVPMETSDYDNDLQAELKHSPASDQFVYRHSVATLARLLQRSRGLMSASWSSTVKRR